MAKIEKFKKLASKLEKSVIIKPDSVINRKTLNIKRR